MNLLTSIIRTLVPALWGSVIAWLLGAVPLLHPLEADLLAVGDLAVPFVIAVIIGLWFALWRWLQPRLPDWLIQLVLGSAKLPVYVPPKADVIVRADGTVDIPGKPDHRA